MMKGIQQLAVLRSLLPNMNQESKKHTIKEGSQQSWRALVDNPWIVLFLLFFVMAILAIPLLWMSRAFSMSSKILLSMVAIGYTGLLFWLTWLVLYWAWLRIDNAIG